MKNLRSSVGASLWIVPAILGLLTMLALASCAGMASAESSAAYDDYRYEDANESSFKALPESGAVTERSAPADAMAGGVAQVAVDDTAAPVSRTLPDADGPEAEESEPAERLRVYSAELEIVVASVQETRDEIIGIVEASGGYVESSQADHLVVRVPAAQFDPILSAIEETGDVRSRAVRTSDVTDQYFDLGRRLRVAESSRERLLELLERAEDPDERVAILRDIRRLTEEIEQLRSSLQSLSQLIRFSRITIGLVSRIQVSQIGRQEIPFWWIASLSPLASTTYAADADIPITPDDSFAVFESGSRLFAEAADGTQFRAGAVANQPLGDEKFWQSALTHHLGPFYRSATPMEAGEYRGVLLESKDSAPFYYLVLVDSREDELIVAEVFFPHSTAKDARLDDALAAIDGGAE
jgi:uncharacterized protein DUF4349